jgi:hypothetical protein
VDPRSVVMVDYRVDLLYDVALILMWEETAETAHVVGQT